ncbi:MAG: LacI family DNA-binding transcriptional regulator [Verrucomicrobiota bacterium]
MMDQRVTMAQLARNLGVAESTVSRALRNDPKISARTRKRVKAQAEKSGYRPNALISALMANRRGLQGPHPDTVALITDYREKGGWRSKDVCQWEYHGICQRAAKLGYRIEEFALADFGHDGTRLEKALRTRNIRGVLFGFSRGQAGDFRFNPDHFSVAGLSSYFNQLSLDRANFHGLYNVSLAMESLKNLGYRRIGLVVPEFNNRISGYQWSGGSLDWQRRQTAESRCAPLIIGEDSDQSGHFNRWLDREKPDSLVVYKLPVRAWISRQQRPSARSIAITHLYRSQAERDQSAGIDGNLDLVGAAAFDLVVEGLHTNRTGLPENPKEVLIKGSWHSDHLRME